MGVHVDIKLKDLEFGEFGEGGGEVPEIVAGAVGDVELAEIGYIGKGHSKHIIVYISYGQRQTFKILTQSDWTYTCTIESNPFCLIKS